MYKMNHQLCMFLLIIFTFTMHFVRINTASIPMNNYYDKFKFEDTDPVELMNKRFVNYYVNCLLGDGKCAGDARRLKEIINEAILTHCAKCTPNQKNYIERVIDILRKQYPKEYCRVVTKYDSNTQYRHKNEITNDDDSDCV